MLKVAEVHKSEYDCQPDIVVSAPGRFHLLGDHSWYFRDKTLSMAVNLPVYIAISVRHDSSLRFYFPQLKERKRANVATLKYRREDRWANSVKAIVYSYTHRDFPVRGMNVTIYSDILPSAGFGITTAIKVASAVALRSLYGYTCSDTELLSIIQKANRDFLGTGSYLADIYTTLYGREDSCLLTDHERGTYEYVPFVFPDTQLLLTDARVPRIPVWDENTLHTEENLRLLSELKIEKNGVKTYEESDAEIKDVLAPLNEEARRRLLCVMRELKHVNDAVEALNTVNFPLFARTVNRSHEELRDLYEISCPEIDWLIKRVQEFDMQIGKKETACSRITGKGFGRCTFTVLPVKDVESYSQKLIEYERIFGFHPAVYPVKASSGAAVL